MSIDLCLFQYINGLAGKSVCLDSLAIFFAEYLQYFLMAVLFFFLIKNFKKYLPMVIVGLSASMLARFGIAEMIRFFWHRARPFVENSVNLLLNHDNSYSFPSGHAAFFFALSAVIYHYNKKTGIIFFVVSLLISVSRVFCGVHWPLDILGGIIVGIFSAWLALLLGRRMSLAGRKDSLQQQ